ncbi:MAG: fibronectin type III domain-containing protein [Oscillospiraceae bacterium]|nr:fibronectin type III domain-containing protein [Oscillospiraceae bacterium]
MKKRFVKVLVCVLAVALLSGIAMPIAGASITLTFLSPFGFNETNMPINQPLTVRSADVGSGEVLQLRFDRPNDAHIIGSIASDLIAEHTAVSGTGSVIIPANTAGPRPANDFDNWADNAAVVIGVVDDNMAALWASYYAREIEARGTPVVVVVNEMFEQALINGALKNGFTEMRTVTIDAVLYSRSFARAAGANRNDWITANILAGTANVLGRAGDALTDTLTPIETAPPDITSAMLGTDIPTTVSGGSSATVTRAFFHMSQAFRFGDGLPLVVPTQALVDELIAAGNRNRDEIIGRMVGGGLITVENVAVNAVMAGAIPEYFPAVLAIMEAFANDFEDDLLLDRALRQSVQSTIVAVLSGPLWQELGIISDRSDLGVGPLGSGYAATSTIGRAISLSYRNIGLNRPEDTSVRGGMARIQDHVIAVTAESTEPLNRPAGSGWAMTHSENMGFGSSTNTVTLVVVNQARFTAGIGGGLGTFNVGGPPALGGNPGTNVITSITAAGAAGAAISDGQPSIVMIAAPHANLMAATHVSGVPQNASQAVGGRGLESKDALVALLVPDVNNRALIWPIVYGGDWSPTRVFNGGAGVGTNGFVTQRVGGGVQVPPSPQNLVVTTPANNTAELTWTALTGAPITGMTLRYEVSADGGNNWVEADGDAYHTFNDLQPGIHTFALRAVNTEARNSAFIDRIDGAGSAFGVRWERSGRGAWVIYSTGVQGTALLAAELE